VEIDAFERFSSSIKTRGTKMNGLVLAATGAGGWADVILTSMVVLVAILMTFFILLQEGKGGGLTALGGTKAAGVEGVTNPIRRATAWLAGIMFVLLIVLGIMHRPSPTTSLGEDKSAAAENASPGEAANPAVVPAVPAAAVPTVPTVPAAPVAPAPDANKAPALKAGEAEKPDATKTDATKTEAPKVDGTKTETPKADASKTDATKTEAPKPEVPKAEAPAPAAGPKK
jgi:protein translocase SecG subunit